TSTASRGTTRTPPSSPASRARRRSGPRTPCSGPAAASQARPAGTAAPPTRCPPATSSSWATTASRATTRASGVRCRSATSRGRRSSSTGRGTAPTAGCAGTGSGGWCTRSLSELTMASEANEPGSEHPARSPRIVRRSRHAYSDSLLGEQLPERRVERLGLFQEGRVRALGEHGQLRARDLRRQILAVRERQERVVLPVQDGGRDLELLRPRAEIGGEQRVETGLGHGGRGFL